MMPAIMIAALAAGLAASSFCIGTVPAVVAGCLTAIVAALATVGIIRGPR